jgi:hypothetical protein
MGVIGGGGGTRGFLRRRAVGATEAFHRRGPGGSVLARSGGLRLASGSHMRWRSPRGHGATIRSFRANLSVSLSAKETRRPPRRPLPIPTVQRSSTFGRLGLEAASQLSRRWRLTHKRSPAPFLVRSADLRPFVFPDESAAVVLARARRNGVLFERGESFLIPAVHLQWLALCRVIRTVAIENPRIRPRGQNPAIDERSTPTQGKPSRI